MIDINRRNFLFGSAAAAAFAGCATCKLGTRQLKPGAVPVDWDKLFVASDKDGVKWYVVECERHEDKLWAVDESIKFLKSKGRA